MVEAAYQEYGQGGERLAVRLRDQVRGERHLADVEFGGAHHPAERLGEHRDLLEPEVNVPRPAGPVLQGLGAALGACHRGKREVAHNRRA